MAAFETIITLLLSRKCRFFSHVIMDYICAVWSCCFLLGKSYKWAQSTWFGLRFGQGGVQKIKSYLFDYIYPVCFHCGSVTVEFSIIKFPITLISARLLRHGWKVATNYTSPYEDVYHTNRLNSTGGSVAIIITKVIPQHSVFQGYQGYGEH